MPGSARERLEHTYSTIDDEAAPIAAWQFAAQLDAIEAEAITAERARLREVVEGLPRSVTTIYWAKGTSLAGATTEYPMLELSAVLAALEEPDAR